MLLSPGNGRQIHWAAEVPIMIMVMVRGDQGGGIMQGGSKKWVDSKKHGVTQQGTPQTDLIGKRKREGEWLARTVLVGISEFHVGRG